MKKSLWTTEEVERFLDTAFSNFTWRSLGLLAAYTYELGLRPTEIRDLTWDKVDLTSFTVVTKDLSLPLSENLKEMTKQQKDEWDFQPYVFAYLRKSDNAYRPLTKQMIREQAQYVVAKAGLRKGLTLERLRDTALVEMYKEGVSRYELMCLTGIKDGAYLDALFGVDPITAYNTAKKRGDQLKLTLKGRNDGL